LSRDDAATYSALNSRVHIENNDRHAAGVDADSTAAALITGNALIAYSGVAVEKMTKNMATAPPAMHPVQTVFV
jgi:hypothetical protein